MFSLFGLNSCRLLLLLHVSVPHAYVVDAPIVDESTIKEDVKYCEDKYAQCILESYEGRDCLTERCNCLKGIKGYQQECVVPQIIVNQASIIKELETKVMKHFNHYKDNLTDNEEYKRRVEDLKSNMSKFDMSVFSNTKIASAIVLNEMVLLNKFPEKLVNRLEKTLIDIDQRTHFELRISFVQWHCGWELGDISRVIFRATALFASPSAAISFNHCCAARRNCYFRETSGEDCEKYLKKCTKNVVSSSKTHKNGSIEFQKILDELSEWSRERAHGIANLTETSYVTHSAYLDKGFEKFEMKENTSSVVFLELSNEYEEKLRKPIIKMYKECKDNKIELSSCVNSFLVCNQSIDLSIEVCFETINKCFSEIKNLGKRCFEAMSEVKEATSQPGTWDKLLSYFRDNYWWYIVYSALSFMVVIIEAGWYVHKFVEWILAHIQKDKKKLQKPQQAQPISEEETSLTVFSS